MLACYAGLKQKLPDKLVKSVKKVVSKSVALAHHINF